MISSSAAAVIRRILDSAEQRKKALSVLQDRHFCSGIDKFLFRCVRVLDQTCHEAISFDILSEFIERQPISEKIKGEVHVAIGEMAAYGSLVASDFDYHLAHLIEDARREHYLLAMEKAANLLSKNQLHEAEKVFQQASVSNRELLLEDDRMCSARTLGSLEPDREGERLATGFQVLDRVTGGGRISEFWLWAAYLGEFKSFALLSIAHHNMLKGNNVLYVSLEMDREEIQRRLVCIHASYLNQDLQYRDVEFGTYDRDVYERVVQDFDSNPVYGDVQIWRPPLGTTIADVSRQLELCRLSYEIKILILDYVQLLRPSRYTGRVRDELNETLETTKRVAVECNVWIVSGYQTSTEGRKQAEKEGGYTKWSVGETIVAARIANVIAWSLQTDSMRDANEAKLGLSKSRNSSVSNSRHYVVADPATGLLSAEPIRMDTPIGGSTDFQVV